MDSFIVKCADQGSTIEFFDREVDPSAHPIEHFSIRISDTNLQAMARVCDYRSKDHCLADIFREMANEWRRWTGFKTWESLEYELKLKFANDGRGHVTCDLELQSGHHDLAWHVQSSVVVEVGQLDGLAWEAEAFFGSRT